MSIRRAVSAPASTSAFTVSNLSGPNWQPYESAVPPIGPLRFRSHVGKRAHHPFTTSARPSILANIRASVGEAGGKRGRMRESAARRAIVSLAESVRSEED